MFYSPGERIIFVAVFAGVDGIVCFANEMASLLWSSATQNWLKMPDV